jgi:pyruvate kinase
MCRQYQRPVIIATQMLESMHTSTRPTRAEATDVANAILDGADACMLSGETAIGQYPVEAVSMMNRIALATEGEVTPTAKFSVKDFSVRGLHPVTQSVVRGAGEIARWLNAKLVVVASHSGATAQAISSLRGQVPVIGVSSVEVTLRRMCLYWGVTPLRGLPAEDVQKLIDRADQWGLANGLLSEGDLLVTVGGSHLSQGMHDLVAVHQVGAAPKGS